MANQCGAKTRAGGSCRAPAMRNGRCRVHGGQSTGPKDQAGNTNAVTHGIYSAGLSDEENGIYHRLTLGSVDDELRLCRIRLRRALIAQKAIDEAPDDEVVGFVLSEIEQTDGTVEDKLTDSKKVTKKRPDYQAIIDRLLGRIESLEKTRADLLKKDDGLPDTLDGFTFTVRRAKRDDP